MAMFSCSEEPAAPAEGPVPSTPVPAAAPATPSPLGLLLGRHRRAGAQVAAMPATAAVVVGAPAPQPGSVPNLSRDVPVTGQGSENAVPGRPVTSAHLGIDSVPTALATGAPAAPGPAR
jgi:hypothetical protein